MSVDGLTDEKLDGIGKLLVLAAGHKLSTADIQRITRASSVEQLAPEDSLEDIAAFVHEAVSRWLEMTGPHATYSFAAYLVRGDLATSEWLKLQAGDKVLLTIELNSSSAKQLLGATYLGCQLLDLQDHFNGLWRAHENLRKKLKIFRTKNTLEGSTRSLRAVHKQYGMKELRELADLMKDSVRPTW